MFWISTLLKQYVAIDLNTWLNNPTMTIGGLVLLGVVVGALWALVIGGDRRGMLIVFATAALATISVMYLLLVTGFFREPYFGILGIASSGSRRGRMERPVRRAAPARPERADLPVATVAPGR